MKQKKSISLSSDAFTRGADQIIGAEDLERAFGEGKKLKIKLGIDATAPFLHIGHAVTLWKLRELQEAGHLVQILLGDFTTRIGDPTGRSKARPVLSPKEIEKNAKKIFSDIGKILLRDPRVFELRRNSEWYKKMKTGEFLQILSLVTHARLIERDMFQERMRRGEEIHMHELLYPVLQGYDSYMLGSDCTIIGSDQLFNESMGRFLQEKFGMRPQSIVTVKLLPGLDGKEKMSKSAGNYIAIADSPRDMFGKAMTLPDGLINDYLIMYTDVPIEEITRWRAKVEEGENPMNAKLFLAEALVRRYHGGAAGQRERDYFVSLFSKKEIPDTVPARAIRHGGYDALSFVMETGMVESRSDARRLIGEGAIEVDGKTLASPRENVSVRPGIIVRIGKKKIFRIL